MSAILLHHAFESRYFCLFAQIFKTFVSTTQFLAYVECYICAENICSLYFFITCGTTCTEFYTLKIQTKWFATL